MSLAMHLICAKHSTGTKYYALIQSTKTLPEVETEIWDVGLLTLQSPNGTGCLSFLKINRDKTYASNGLCVFNLYTGIWVNTHQLPDPDFTDPEILSWVKLTTLEHYRNFYQTYLKDEKARMEMFERINPGASAFIQKPLPTTESKP